MNILISLIGGIVGYLVGSISFARIIIAIREPDAAIEKIHTTLPGTDADFSSTSISASTVMHQLGPKWGGITMALDMLKAVIPTLAFRLLYPDMDAYMVVALSVMLGHNYPIYYQFKGGRGLATMMGGFFVFDFIGILCSSILGVVLGVLSGQVVLIRWTGILFMILWAILFHEGWQATVYVVLANLIFWFAMRKEIARFLELRRKKEIQDQKIVAEFMGMGSMYGFIERFSIPGIIRRWRSKKMKT
ncbi:MAG: glycerol-3-phosphate acyltransferase [Anaerolineae bacterium]|jgi:glycerol-3-phosphate acyltransferase PlsY|nr:glycerol-3-phosphate acyltransferase [Anaerolineae bacterium]